jgi:two-component system OmpR family response regulator
MMGDAAPSKGLYGSVLIIERDPSTRQLLQELLGEHTLVTGAVETLGEARAALGAAQPDVLVLDWRPSGEGSGAVLQALLLTSDATLPAIIVLSTAPEPATLPSGVVAWFQKPFDSVELLRAVLRHVRRPPAGAP